MKDLQMNDNFESQEQKGVKTYEHEDLSTIIDEIHDLKERITQKNWMDSKELEEYLGISKRTIQRYVSNNKIPYSKTQGILRFNRRQIDLWLLHNGDKISFTQREIKRFKNILN